MTLMVFLCFGLAFLYSFKNKKIHFQSSILSVEAKACKIDGFMTSDLPGREVVPLAIYYRYLKRIVANLVGIVRIAVEPILQVDYLDEGATDTDD